MRNIKGFKIPKDMENLIRETIWRIKIISSITGIHLSNADDEILQSLNFKVDEIVSALELMSSDFNAFTRKIVEDAKKIRTYRCEAEKYIKLKKKLHHLKKLSRKLPWLKKGILKNINRNFTTAHLVLQEQKVNFELGTELTKNQFESIAMQNAFLFRKITNKLDELMAHAAMEFSQIEESSIQTMKFLRSWMTEYEAKTKEMAKVYELQSEKYETQIQRWTNDLKNFIELSESEMKFFKKLESEVNEYDAQKQTKEDE